MEFEHEVCKKFVKLYQDEVDKGTMPDEQFFIHQPDKQLVDMVVDMLTPMYILSENWEKMHKITTGNEQKDLKRTVFNGIYHLKKFKIDRILDKLIRDLQHTTNEADVELLQSQYIFMKKIQKKITDELGTVITK